VDEITRAAKQGSAAAEVKLAKISKYIRHSKNKRPRILVEGNSQFLFLYSPRGINKLGLTRILPCGKSNFTGTLTYVSSGATANRKSN
jgi:hypothetical protein